MTIATIETRLRRIEEHPRFRGGLARLSDTELDAAIVDIGARLVAECGCLAALLDELEASGEELDRRLLTYLRADPELMMRFEAAA